MLSSWIFFQLTTTTTTLQLLHNGTATLVTIVWTPLTAKIMGNS